MRLLDEDFVLERSDVDRLVLLCRDKVTRLWLGRKSLQADVDSLGLGFGLDASIILDTLQELITAGRVANMLNANVDSLFNETVSDTLVDDQTESRLGNVVDNSGFTRKNLEQIEQA